VLALILLLVAVFGQPAPAQEASLIDRFTGAWEGHGELFRTDATFSMKWEWVLARKFVHLTFQNRVQGSGGVERVLEAQAFYKPSGEGEFEGTWFDSRGMVLPLRASVEDSTLTVLWGTPETEQGRTIYRLIEENKIAVEDLVLKGDQWHPFGHASYGRLATGR
jgi:hypothetical protein